MKKIVCELCEGNQFVKENGMFVCQGCGTSYSLEEAKGMMKEVDGEETSTVTAPTSGAPQPVPQVNPNQQQLDNILLLASSAYEADNKAEAENYCNQAIVIDAMCYKAWFLKGKAVGWQSTIANIRIEEAAHSFCKAIDFAPEDEKEEIKEQATEELKNLGLALISLRKDRFIASPDLKELNGFSTDKKVVLDAILVLLSHGNSVGIPEGYLENVATLMNQAGVGALNTVREAWKKVQYPNKADWDTYIGWCTNITAIFQLAIDTSDNDDEEDIVRYKNKIIALEEPLNSCSYKLVWSSLFSEYIHEKEYSLSDSAKEARKKMVQECNDKIAEIQRKLHEKELEEKRKAEEEKKARIAAYWEAHADEKAELDSELKELEAKRDPLRQEVLQINNEISANQPKGKVPSEEESDRLKSQISELNARKANLGVLAGKEKKQIGEEVASLEGRLASLQKRIQQEQIDRNLEVNQKNAPLITKRNEINGELTKISKRIDEINKILQKDPEE